MGKVGLVDGFATATKSELELAGGDSAAIYVVIINVIMNTRAISLKAISFKISPANGE